MAAKKKAAKKSPAKKKPAAKKRGAKILETNKGSGDLHGEILKTKRKGGGDSFTVILKSPTKFKTSKFPGRKSSFRGAFNSIAAARVALADGLGKSNPGNPGHSGGSHVAKAKPDRTPSRPARSGVPRLQMKIDSRTEIEFVPEDLLAMSLAMLLAMRLETARIGEEEGEFVALLTDWFSSEAARRSGLSGLDMSRKDLSDEIQFFREAFKALPAAAAKVGFAVEEWNRFWAAVHGEPVVSFGEISILGLDAPVPPVVGEITTMFRAGGGDVAGHPAIDIAVDTGTPVRAPEDMVVAKVDKTSTTGFGLLVTAWSRTPELGDFPDVGARGTIVPQEGVRKHLFGHLSSINVSPGDKLERGAVFAHSGDTGTSTGPHVHWAMKIFVVQGNLFGKLFDASGIALPGAIALTPMDPVSFVPADVIEGGGTPRPPALAWTMINPDAPSETIAGPSYDIRVGTGDVIFSGSKNVRTKRSDVTVDPDITVDVPIGILRPADPRVLKVRGGLEAERLVRSPGFLGFAPPIETPSPFEAADPAPRVVSGFATRAEADEALTRGAARERVAISGVTGAATGAVAGAPGGPIGALVGGLVGAAAGTVSGVLGLPKRPEGAARPRRRRQ